MPRFSANLSILWPDLAVYDRFEAASRAGFRFVEIGVIETLDADQIRRLLDDLRLTLVLFNAAVGDVTIGELGLVAVPGREADFARVVTEALALASRLGTKMLNTLLGVATGVSHEEAQRTAIRNLSIAAQAAAEIGVTVLVEAVNPVDVPGYFASTTADAAKLVDAVDMPNVRLLFDVYHAAIVGEDPVDSLQRYFPLISHIHVADYPGRNEPGTGKQPITHFIAETDRLSYKGFIGLEYRPSGDMAASLRWLKSFPE